MVLILIKKLKHIKVILIFFKEFIENSLNSIHHTKLLISKMKTSLERMLRHKETNLKITIQRFKVKFKL